MSQVNPQKIIDAQGAIKHVILLLDNRSLDQELGCFKSEYTDLKVIDPQAPSFKADSSGTQFFQKETTEKQTALDPRHKTEHIPLDRRLPSSHLSVLINATVLRVDGLYQ